MRRWNQFVGSTVEVEYELADSGKRKKAVADVEKGDVENNEVVSNGINTIIETNSTVMVLEENKIYKKEGRNGLSEVGWFEKIRFLRLIEQK